MGRVRKRRIKVITAVSLEKLESMVAINSVDKTVGTGLRRKVRTSLNFPFCKVEARIYGT